MRNEDAIRRQKILNHQAEQKSERQPNCMGNCLRRKSVTTIKSITSNVRHAHLSHAEIDRRLTLKCRRGAAFLVQLLGIKASIT